MAGNITWLVSDGILKDHVVTAIIRIVLGLTFYSLKKV